ncbi:ornithine cyclodeaminase family protein [Rhizobium sp. F40D2]|uniref:ornithine cyclodeaminase family protein n=1 Tax=Rhizobium sp. F40D2 TaxID=3453141 RepID=UPI003F1F37BA
MPTDAQLLLLDAGNVAQLMEPAKVFEAMKRAFTLHSQREGRVFPVVREQLHTGGVFGIKSGDIPRADLLGFKAAGFWPNNRSVGKEPHQATILLIDPHTGRPVCLIDGNTITTVRTGAAGALGLTLLARPQSTSLCIFGTGTQARIQLSFALRYMPKIDRVRYLTALGQPDEPFEEEFGGLCALAHARDADAAVSASDIVVTATPGFGPLFSPAAVRAGTHINCVGADTKGKRELPEGLLRRSRVFTDDRAQSRSIGEGQWDVECLATEIGDVLTAKVQLTRDPEDITVFDMTGLALQDLVVAEMLLQLAEAKGQGSSLAWSW